ncbi:MAG: ATP-dependent protease [Candidatus Binatia bacterium]|nr:MAG: ATP-dependent protease [Candidatus Binatia bacterium]
MELPEQLPLFPLPNVVLFPGVPLPLHVFEPRYRALVRDVRGSHRLVGMTLLRGDWKPRYFENPEIFAVGCAGKITELEELPDGRFFLLLEGVREFTVLSEDRSRPYRVARVAWRDALEAETPLAPELRARILERLRLCPPPGVDDRVRRVLETAGDGFLVNFFCHALDTEPVEKQALLEAPSLGERARRLCDVLDFLAHLRTRGRRDEPPH